MRANKEVNGVPRFRKLNCQQGKKQDETAVKKRGNIYLGLVTLSQQNTNEQHRYCKPSTPLDFKNKKIKRGN